MKATFHPFSQFCFMSLKKTTIQIFLFLILVCIWHRSKAQEGKIVCGADRPDQYLSLLKGKRIGLVVNHTATAQGMHLVDFLS